MKMVPDQIISVINELCDKFGIAVDWSQKIFSHI